MNKIDDFFDTVYFISFNDNERYEYITSYLSKLNINKTTHICPKKPGLFEKYKNRRVSLSALSCRDAHLSCYEDMLRNNYQHVLIFEDDIIPKEGLTDDDLLIEFEKAIRFLSSFDDWDLFYFDNVDGSLFEPYFEHVAGSTFRKRRKRVGLLDLQKDKIQSNEHNNEDFAKIIGKFATHSYCIKPELARFLLNEVPKTGITIDRFLKTRLSSFNIFCAKNGILSQRLDWKSLVRQS